MGLEDMIARIKEEAEKEAGSILEDARKKASKIEMEGERETSNMISELHRKLDKEASAQTNIYLSEGKRKARQAILSAKEDLIWETISETRSRLSSMGPENLSQILDHLYEKTSRVLGHDISVFPVRDMDRIALEGKAGIKDPIEISNELPSPVRRFKGKDLLGGFIAITQDGSRVVNMSFKGLLEKDEERIREMIADTLFGR